MVYENKNYADGLLRVLQELHQYVPFDGEDDEWQQGVGGDQRSVERGDNRTALWQMASPPGLSLIFPLKLPGI